MPNILILGGAGYLGTALGQALIRTGNHHVFATTRDAKKARPLQEGEVTPLVGELSDAAWVEKIIAEHYIDVVIDTSQAYEHVGKILQAVVQAGKSRAEILRKDGAPQSPKLGFVYCSGSWIHGSPKRLINDLTPPGTSLAGDKSAAIVAWKPGHEQAVLAARDVLDVAIIRPSAIYGRGSWVWGVWWKQLLDGASLSADSTISIPADRDINISAVHVDDVADAFVLAVDKIDGQLGNWPVFDVRAETFPLTASIDAAAKELGVSAKIEYAGTHGDVFLEALSLSTRADTSRSYSVLGWKPKRRDFLLNTGRIVAAWKITQE